MKRVLTAAILAPVALAAVLLAPDLVFALLLLLVAFGGVREFYDLAQAQGHEPYRWIGLALTAAVLMREAVDWQGAPSLDLILVAGLLVTLVRCLSRTERMNAGIGDAAATLMGVFYPGLLTALLGAIRSYPGGPVWLVYLMLTVWIGDSAALYAGKAWGRHPMAPQASPKKTWEGGVASVIASVLVGVGFGCWSRLGASGSVAINIAVLGGLALAINVAAQAGDLVESVLKRGAQVKDSGALLPGHGGVLDRMDALLFAAPVLWYYLYFHV